MKHVSLTIHEGENLGLAEVSGNGQRELAEAINGLRANDEGSIEVDGRPVIGFIPAECRGAGLGYVPDERIRDGAIGSLSVAVSLMLVDHGKAPFARRGTLQLGEIERHSADMVSRFAGKTPRTATTIKSFREATSSKAAISCKHHMSAVAESFVVQRRATPRR